MSDTAADRFALQDVMSRYAAGVDERDLDMYRACFDDDVEVVGFGGKTIRGGDAWRDYVATALEAFGPTQHMLGPVYARIEGDEAECRTDVQALHYLVGRPDTTLTLWATYKTRMRRQRGDWKIVRHELVSRGTRTQSDA